MKRTSKYTYVFILYNDILLHILCRFLTKHTALTLIYREVKKKKGDERRSHGALCAITALDMKEKIPQVLLGGAKLTTRARIQCVVKSTFSETRLVRK